MIEIRLHGRGGQGAVTASRLLATAAFLEGKYSQSIPMYGTERRGAPVTAFVRIGEKNKMVKSLVHQPDCVIVLDSLLRKTVDITEGLKEGGTVVLNSALPPDEIELVSPFKVVTVDATGIALKTLGRPITNTAIMGAFCRGTGEIALESVIEAVKLQWSGVLGEANAQVVKAAYDNTLIGEPKIVEEVKRSAAPSGSKSDWRTFRPEVDTEKCTGCRMCWVFCPEHSVEIVDGVSVIDYDYCKGCGICAEECPVEAISMKMESEA